VIVDASAIYSALERKDSVSLAGHTTLDLAFYEVGSAAHEAFRRGDILEPALSRLTHSLSVLGASIGVFPFRELDQGRVAKSSKQTSLTFYDSAYLSLAIESGQPLVTEDVALAREARRLGVRKGTL
jgi:predicted nucleic acid-binding protein